ncbi:MAG: glycosyltransferase family 4 protein [Abitibacteriaceae bacterium]|nr:glycosyltransferase family 4 protein [Abditibacteriaceae bacterium]
MMNIGIDATALYGRYGGVEYALWNLLGALHAIDQENAYTVYIPHDGPPQDHLSSFNSRWRWMRLPFEGNHKARRVLWQQTQLPRQLKRDGCSLLHAPTYIAPLLATVPTVLTVYDLIALTHPEFATRLNRVHYGALLQRCLARARGIIVPSEAIKAEVSQRVPTSAARTHVIPLGVEPLFFKAHNKATQEDVRARYALPERYLLFVGNFEPKKNLRNVLRALDHIKLPVPLVVVGGARAWTGYELKDLTGASANGMANTTDKATTSESKLAAPICSLGYVRRRDLPILYAMSEAFVFPTLAEGFGMPVLEALASGTPVVTSVEAHLPGLDKVALICDPQDPKSIAAQIQRILHEPGLQDQLRQQARAYATPFTWRHNAEMTLEVYRSVGGGT